MDAAEIVRLEKIFVLVLRCVRELAKIATPAQSTQLSIRPNVAPAWAAAAWTVEGSAAFAPANLASPPQPWISLTISREGGLVPRVDDNARATWGDLAGCHQADSGTATRDGHDVPGEWLEPERH
uniref:hypothetical protein n=1 Tax=uncultured Sphingomonas sp. TaxID=158754 RepID=UPI0035CB5AD7